MDRIYQELLALGVPTNLKGFRLIHDCVEILAEHEEQIKIGKVWKMLAEKYNTNTSSLQCDRNIRTAICGMFDRGNQQYIKQIFGTRTRNMTVSEFLNVLAWNLKGKLADGQKSHMISVEGYRAFTGTIRISPVGKQSYEITGDWLYKPDTHCWYGGGSSFHESYCEVL